MKISKKIVLGLTLTFLLSATAVYAASSTDYFTKAKNYIDSNCAKAKISDAIALNCYLFYKLGELGTQINSNTSSITALENQVDELETRVFLLENPQSPTPSPSPQPEINQILDFNQAFNVPSGYNVMIIEIQNEISFPWAPAPSFNNGSSYVEQHRYSSGISNATIPVLSDKYQIGSGAPTNVKVRVRLQSDPESQVITFGSNSSYPFTSAPFDFTGYTQLLVTASGGNNPQNITAIVLQREEGGVFVEIARSVCDGGAECPPTSFIIVGGNYKIAVEGSGSGALFAGLLRRP